jgi:hypothetical protein
MEIRLVVPELLHAYRRTVGEGGEEKLMGAFFATFSFKHA